MPDIEEQLLILANQGHVLSKNVVDLLRDSSRVIKEQKHKIESLESERQQKAVDAGFKYWRSSDAQGIKGTKEQAELFIADLVGVEVEILP